MVGGAGVQRIEPWPFKDAEPRIQPDIEGWIWTIGFGFGVHKASTEREARRAALSAALAHISPDLAAVMALIEEEMHDAE
jgi:hypothetical protein